MSPPTVSTTPAQRGLSMGRERSVTAARLTTSAAAKLGEKRGLIRFARRCDDAEALLRQQRDGHATHASARPGDQYLALRGIDAGHEHPPYRHGCSEACCPVYHAFACGEALRQRHGPVGWNTNILAKAAVRIHTQVVPDDDDGVADLELGDGAGNNDARGINPRRVGKCTRHASIPRGRERVLVIERGVADPDQ